MKGADGVTVSADAITNIKGLQNNQADITTTNNDNKAQQVQEAAPLRSLLSAEE